MIITINIFNTVDYNMCRFYVNISYLLIKKLKSDSIKYKFKRFFETQEGGNNE